MRSGGTGISSDSSRLAVFSLLGTLTLFSLGSDVPTQSYKYVESMDAHYPVSVVFLNDGRELTCGSSMGKIHVWDSYSGLVRQLLDYEGK